MFYFIMKINIAMKTIKNLILISLIAITTGCVNSDEYNAPDLSGECVNLTTTKVVSDITSTATTTATIYPTEDIIEAYVTSSDEGGNFYKSISFQSVDGSIGFSMPVDTYNLFNEFEPGRLVYINMKNRYVMKKHSSTLIGSLYEGEVGRISGVEYKEVLKRSCTKVDEDEIVSYMTITEALNDQHLNKLIEFDNVQFTNTSLGHTFFDKSLNPVPTFTATNHLITDNLGQQVIVRVSEFANFASNTIPSGSGKIRGVLTKYNSDYQFMIRTINDVKLNEERFQLLIPFFSEDFQTATNNTNLNNPGWTNFAESGSWLWREKTYQGNGYAEFSAYGSGATVNKVWLITPAINLDNTINEVLAFKIAQHHLDVDSPENSLEVLISTDYDGTNVLSANWQNLSANLPNMDTPWYQFLTSFINVSNYSGNVHIAFKFTGSGTDLTLDGAFQVDDVKVYGE